MKEEAGDITAVTRIIKSLGVKDKTRAKYIYQKLIELDKDAQAELWDDYVKKKIITKEVAKQIGEFHKR